MSEQLALFEGRALRDAALDHLAETHEEYFTRAQKWAIAYAKLNGSVTVDDVYRACPPPADTDGRVMGSVMRCKALRAGEYVPTTRASSHGRPVRRFYPPGATT